MHDTSIENGTNFIKNYIQDKKGTLVEIYNISSDYNYKVIYLAKILIKKIKKTYTVKKVFVHRDFHIENLILIKNKIGLIDNQDAVIGHPVYDIASLIDDVRTKLSKKDQENLIKYYIKKSIYKGKNFISDFHILSVQRLLKILGIFLRLYKRDNKKKYLRFLDRTWNLINLRLAHNDLQDLQVIFNKYFNKKIKNKKWK